MLNRLGLDIGDIVSGDYLTAETGDIVINNSNYEGNSYAEILASFPANSLRSQYTGAAYKPNYLLTVGNLPTSFEPQILQGSAKAVYDTDKTYYSLSEAECIKLNKEADTELNTFEFNALLLYYNNGNFDQVAGLYFPDAFEQLDNTWVLPTISKTYDKGLGYSINIAHNMSNQLQFVAGNADMLIAMQNYSANLNKLLAYDTKMVVMQESLQSMQEQLNIMSVNLFNGKIDQLVSNVNALSVKLATKFNGTVSPDRLLSLFLAAKNSQNALTLSMSMSDLSKSMTNKDIKVSNAYGTWQVGDSIPAGYDITEILSRMLSDMSVPTYTAPTLTLNYGSITDTVVVPFGDANPVVFGTAYELNDAGTLVALAVEAIEPGMITNLPDAIYYPGANGIFQPVTIQAILQFNEGVTKTYPDNTPCYKGKIYAGSISRTMTIVPDYSFGFGSLDSLDALTVDYDTDNLQYDSILDIASNYTSDKLVMLIATPKLAPIPMRNSYAKSVDIEIAGTMYTIYAITDAVMNIK
jgi:hypothetical protein